ncbi:hypothetical protein GCM10027055_21550 [Janibacter alkaliphilus]|uniref:Uncharacterized protein n=1 Tax=Janibacter alkaliphilus TaxID=1069963 RepID=A0A852X7Z6_9MICO|nr:hypothetical protein [Janibacter alkaliphilus]NYG38537.1 hypothetical protein [Janibacter alkaliphilus]
MTVTTLRTPQRSERLTLTWVPVRGADGRTRMEMRWTDNTRRASRRSAA